MKRKAITLVLCLAILLQCFILPVSATENSYIQTTFTVKQIDESFLIDVWSEPNADVSITILNPEGVYPPSGSDMEALLTSFAYLGEVKTDGNGYGQFVFPCADKQGTFTVGYSKNVTKAAIYSGTSSPFFALTWPSIDTVFDNIINVPTMSLEGAFQTNDMAVNAQTLANKTAAMPSGKKAVFFANFVGFDDWLTEAARNYIWWDAGAEKLHTYLSGLFEAYAALGETLDYIYLDLETYLRVSALGNDSAVYQAIEADDAYQTEIRPLLSERDFPFSESESGELSVLTDKEGADYAKAVRIWDVVMDNRVADYLTYAVYEPAAAFFPDIKVSDYDHSDLDAWYKIPNYSGTAVYEGGNLVKVGTHSGNFVYGDQLSGVTAKPPEDFIGLNFSASPFRAMLFDINECRAVYLSDPAHKMQPWVAYYDYAGQVSTSLANSPYYTEAIFHAAMLNPDPFLFYVPNNTASYETVLERERVLSVILDELSALMGTKDREPIMVQAPNWNNRYVLSGMSTGGKNIWRITPDNTVPGITLESFLTREDEPTFSIAGQTITFPEGALIEYNGGNDTFGYWVETPIGVYPEISYSAEAFRLNPSLGLDFEEYSAETLPKAYTYEAGTTNPKRAIYPLSGEPTVKKESEAEDNQVLSVNGSEAAWRYIVFTEKIKVLGKEKRQQVWEIKVKLPSVSNSYFSTPTIDLFKFGAGRWEAPNSGVRIEGNKAYTYNDGTKISLLSSGQSLTAGVWYRIKLMTDFAENGVVTGAAFIYDENDVLLGKQENLALGTCGFPVGNLYFSAKNYQSGEEVLFDDFLIYPHGADFSLELYKDAVGTKFGEAAADDAVMARLAYVNATEEPVDYVLVRAQYQGNQLKAAEAISEGSIPAGADGTVFCELLAPGDGIDSESYFLWDSLGNMRPLLTKQSIAR